MDSRVLCVLAMPGGMWSPCTSQHSKHTLNTQHTRIHDMLPHPSHYVMFMFLQVLLARNMSAP
jgi:hypothetical protein